MKDDLSAACRKQRKYMAKKITQWNVATFGLPGSLIIYCSRTAGLTTVYITVAN